MVETPEIRIKVDVYKAESLTETLSIAHDISQEMKIPGRNRIWFRGVRCSDFELVPGAYRDKFYDEKRAFSEFCDYGIRFQELRLNTFWDRYFAAQHFGLPTRLIDWSESWAHALFFAFDGWKGDSTPCIWVLNPTLLNRLFHDKLSLVEQEDTDFLDPWTNVNQEDSVEVKPVAMQPRRSNLRIIAQHGAFTLHGNHAHSLERQLFEDRGKVPKDILRRIDLVGFDPSAVQPWLALLGVTRESIYPDIENFVRSLRERVAI